MVRTIHQNPGFKCQHCGHDTPPLEKSCRNHCNRCLHSLHVDLEKPGDRQNSCKGLMKPEKLEQNRQKGYIIVSRCLKCGAIKRNFAASDDNLEELIILSQPKTPLQKPPKKSSTKKHAHSTPRKNHR